MDGGQRKGISSIVAVVAILIVAAVPSDGSEIDVQEEDQWVEQREWEGRISWAAAWHAEIPVEGCVVVPNAGPQAIKSCGGLRGTGSINGEVPFDVADTVDTIALRLEWEPSTPGSALQLDALCPEVPRSSNGAVNDLDHPCYFNPPGGTQGPIEIQLDRDHWEEFGYDPLGAWAARVFASANTLGTQEDLGLGAGYALEQPFTVYLELHHSSPDH